MSGLVCIDCDDDAEPGFLRCAKHTQEFNALPVLVPLAEVETIAKAKIAEAANRLHARAKDFEVEAMCHAHDPDAVELHDRYMLIVEVLTEVANYLKDPT